VICLYNVPTDEFGNTTRSLDLLDITGFKKVISFFDCENAFKK
jgi:hypothetical protein